MAPLTFRLMACVFSCSEMSLLPDAESSLVKQLQERWIVEMFHMFVFFFSQDRKRKAECMDHLL